MLAAMFSGRHGVKKEEDGTIFIDRDGTHFRYILNYLRDGGLSTDALPRNRQTLRELRNEAVYFQLHGLVQHIEKFLWLTTAGADSSSQGGHPKAEEIDVFAKVQLFKSRSLKAWCL